MKTVRKSGILLHITSLPGPYGIGELGPEAKKFVDILADMGQQVWQVLPVGPTSYGDSPYQSLSSFAGNPLFISFDFLIKDDLLSACNIASFPSFHPGKVEYGPLIFERLAILKTVCQTFFKRASNHKRKGFEAFCKKEAYWLEDYALFMALKDAHQGRPWTEWSEGLAFRDPDTLCRARKQFETSIQNVKIMQYLFHSQWERLHAHCRSKKIKSIGNLPLFVAHDSADVWSNPHLFFLDHRRYPTVVGGVPPDYFSKTGQRWGNPLYDWTVHEKTRFLWWTQRLRKSLERVDILRINHFRGFESYWEIPANQKTAIRGKWIKAPGRLLLKKLKKEFGPLPMIAENLGVITKEAEALRHEFGFPDIKVLQFLVTKKNQSTRALANQVPESCVIYTGTHNNDTIAGWQHKHGKKCTATPWDYIEYVMNTRAHTSIFPLQGIMELGSSARMNFPGRKRGNWQWRFTW
ncbi:MAG: 4-alpha-glucanotransferase [Kiritimatiellae bacterium]|nr:4-alpha-glucanotransferase [Kiritimatiellia bacterium]